MRTVFTAVILTLGAALAPTEAQQAAKIPRVGFLYPGLRSTPIFDVFRRGLADLGYVEGQNIIIEPRFVEGQYERVPELAADLVRLKVDVIAVQGAVTVRPLKKVVKDTPIVFAIVVDPVAEDVVTNLERPGGNVTGITTFDPQQPRKQLELLKEAIPGLKRVAFLGEQAIREDAIKAREEQAHALGLQTQRSRVAAPNPDLEGAFAAFRQGHADAVVVLEEPLVMNHRKRISELAAKDRLPLMFPLSGEDAGGLIAYGTSFVEGYRRMAAYVDKVLKGAKPGELPVEAVNRYELVVNLKTAREIGVTIPPGVLKRADRVIPAEATAGHAIPRVGFLSPVGHPSILFEQFRQGLVDLGYIEGQNIIIEPRFAEGQYERVPELAADLVRLKVDVIAVQGDVTIRAAKNTVTNIPMVFVTVVDPVAEDVVANLERPGGNVTGVTTFDPQQPRKQLELLRQAIPGLRRVALLGDQGVSEALMKATVEKARALGLQTQRLRVAAPTPDLEGAFAAIRREHADALLLLEEPLIGMHRKRIVELAAKNHLPTVSSLTHADAGSLVAYGTSVAEGMRRMAVYVDRVLKGAKPGELSVETVKRHELIVNLKTARDIGVTIPPELLKRADRVIQ